MIELHTRHASRVYLRDMEVPIHTSGKRQVRSRILIGIRVFLFQYGSEKPFLMQTKFANPLRAIRMVARITLSTWTKPSLGSGSTMEDILRSSLLFASLGTLLKCLPPKTKRNLYFRQGSKGKQFTESLMISVNDGTIGIKERNNKWTLLSCG